MSKIARVRSNRRDRRLGKASKFSRPGRSNPSKIGHGGSGQLTSKSRKNMMPKFLEKLKLYRKSNKVAPNDDEKSWAGSLGDLFK